MKLEWVTMRSGTASKTILTIAGISVAAALLLSGCKSPIHPYRVVGESMLPLIAPGDRIMVDETESAISHLRDGDVVVLRHNGMMVKRILAMQGETISGENGKVIRDGKKLDEPYVAATKGDDIAGMMTFAPRTLGPGEIFVMGDNRGLSFDSRFDTYGAVHTSDVTGLYTGTYWHAKTGER